MFSAPQPASRGAETTIPQSTSRRMVASLEFSEVSILRRAMHPRESRRRAHFMLRHNLCPTTRGKGIGWRGFYALLHSAVERQLDESAPQTAPVGTIIGTRSIFGGAHEILIRQVSRYHAAERPDVAAWLAAVV